MRGKSIERWALNQLTSTNLIFTHGFKVPGPQKIRAPFPDIYISRASIHWIYKEKLTNGDAY